MFANRFLSAILLLCLPSCGLAVDYFQDIAPIFSKNCVACHNSNKTEGGLNLESLESLLLGGDSGDSVSKNDPSDSYLMWRVTGEEEPIMPPDDNAVGAKKLTDEEITALNEWIKAGMPLGEKSTSSVVWNSLPENLRPIYSLAHSKDDAFLVLGRGHDAIIQPRDGGPFTHLVDSENGETKTHLDIVQSIAISPDSSRIATGGYRNLKIWKRNTEGRPVLSGLPAGSRIASYSPNREWLAIGSGKGDVAIREFSNPSQAFVFSDHKQRVTGLAWVAAHRLLSCDQSGQWQLTDVRKDKSIQLQTDRELVAKSLIQLGTSVYCLDANSRVLLLSIGQDDHGAALLNTRVLQRYSNVVHLAASHENLQLIIGSSDGMVSVLDSVSLKHIRSFSIGTSVFNFVADQNGSKLFTPLPTPAVWDLVSGKKLFEIGNDRQTQQLIATKQRDVIRQKGVLEQLNKKIPDLKKAAEKEEESVKKLAESKVKARESVKAKKDELAKVAKETEDVESQLKNVDSSKSDLIAKTKKNLEASKKKLTTAQSNLKKAEADLAEREQALAAGKDSLARAKDAIPGLLEQIEKEEREQQNYNELLRSLNQRSTERVRLATFSADSSKLLVYRGKGLQAYHASDGTPYLNFEADSPITGFVDGMGEALTRKGQLLRWNLKADWRLSLSIGNYDSSPFSDRITALDFSPDGMHVAVGSGPPSRFGEIQIVDCKTGDVAKNLGEVHSDSVLGLRFDPSGRKLASGAADKLCKVFDVETGQHIRSFEGHTHHVLGLDWQDDGQVLATASADATIKVWKAESGEQIRTITGFKKEVTALRFVGQTPQIVSSSADGSVRLHDSNNGKQIRTFSGAKDAVFSVSVTGSSERIAAGGQLGQVWTWNVKDAKLVSTTPENKPAE